MNIIKLDAIDSTNDFLKELSQKEIVENYTTVSAESQTNGRGQMGAVWNSEKGKNLIMSILVKNYLNDINEIFNLNIAVSIAVYTVLDKNNIPNLSIKWPNDILSANKKIGGILIENSIKSDGSILSIVGIGLNINQTNFENLPRASSLAVITNCDFDKNKILNDIISEIKFQVSKSQKDNVTMRQEYTNKLFKKDIPSIFNSAENKNFTGIIKGISPIGKLEILTENNVLKTFDLKEVEMIY